VLLLVLLCSAVLATENDCVYYFYGETCPSCQETGRFLDKLEQENPDLKIERFEIYYNRDNLRTVQNYFDVQGVSLDAQGVPVIFLPGVHFIGKNSITQFLESALSSNEGSDCPQLEQEEVIGIIGNDEEPTYLIETLTFSVVTWAGVKDSFNPYALAVLLVLLSILVFQKEKSKIIKSGLFFVIGVKLVYFLFRSGWFTTYDLSQAGFYIYKVIGVGAVLLGLFKLKEGMWPRKAFLFSLGTKKQAKVDKWLRRITAPVGAFLIGFLISLFGLSFMGEKYQIILNLLLEETTKGSAMLLLLYYNLIFVLPLMLLTLLLALVINLIEDYGADKKVDIHNEVMKWKLKAGRILQLVIGLVFVVLGLLVLI